MSDDTQMLIERCIRREEKAWEEFIKRFSGLLYYSAGERLRRNGFIFSHQDIEDIVQTVFLEILDKGRLAEVRERQKIKAWLSIVAQNRALNHMLKKKERLLHETELFRVDDMIADTRGQVDEDLALALEDAIAGLDSRDKIILKLNILHDKKQKDIAAFMKMPLNTVSTVIARRKKDLRKKLKNLKEN